MTRCCAYLLSECSLHISAAVLVAAIVVGPATATAFPGLSNFLSGARTSSTAAREAALAVVQRDAEALSTLGESLPSLTIAGTWTVNQYEASLGAGQSGGQEIVIQPHNGLAGYAQVSVPLINASAWQKHGAAKLTAKAAERSAEVTRLEVDRQVAQYYFSVVGAEALRQAHAESLAAAQETLDVTRARQDEGAATRLDVARAAADVEKARQDAAVQDYAAAIARRALSTLSGVPADSEAPGLQDDLHEEAGLKTWEAKVGNGLPPIDAAVLTRRAADKQASSAWMSLVPTLDATAREDLTNTAGFLGRHEYFTAMLSLTWRLDVKSVGQIRARQAGAAFAHVQEEGARASARDTVHEAWQRVRTGIIRSQAARAQVAQSRIAADAARERYAAGTGTQLDLIQARRDLGSAEASRIQADADLSFARVLLRLSAGEAVD